MAAARESALADARRESRNRRVMYPGEEKFYERLDHARAGSAKKKSRPTSAVSSGPGESRASTPARARVSSAASPAGRTRDRDRDPTSAEGTPSPAPRSAGGSSRASRSLRVSFEAARATGASAARRAARGRDAENADPIGSDPATRRAEEAERALRAAEAQRAAAEAAVAAARAEAERARREALLGPIPDDSESEYGALSPLRSFASPTRASRASRSSRASGSAATRSSPVRSARSSLTRSFMERSGLGSSLSSSIADDLDGAPTAPATPGVFPDDGENRGVAKSGAAPPVAPRSAPAKIPFSVFGGGKKNTLDTRKTPATDKDPPQSPSARAAEPAEKRRETTPKTEDRRSTTEKAKAYAERVRASAARRSARKAAADAEAARRRADAETERLVRESREGASEARAGAERARALQRDATLYSRDMYRRAATAAFVRYYDWRRDAGLSEKSASSSNAFENARLEKELVHATRSMPAFRGLHPRFLPRLFAGASLETHRARDVVAREGERGACALVLVGGECATFKRRDSSRGMESLDPDPDPWNPEARPLRSPYKVAREDDTGVPGPGDAAPARVPVPTRPGWETEAELLGAPPGSGPFVRRTRTGDLFGLGAVRGAREGEARCATLVALSETAVLRVDKRTFDEVMDATRRGEAAKTAAFLRTSPELFPEAEVSDGDLKALALALERVEAPPGARVVTAGDVARGVFFVREGRAEVFAKARVLVDAAGGGELVDQVLSRDGSERGGSERGGSERGGSQGLRRGTGSGGGAAGSPLVERVRDVALGDLVAPAVFGEECLFAPRARRALAGADLPKPGRHAFTVTAARGVGVTVLRLAPGELERLPASVARRILQLARSTAEASREAREALDAPPAAPAGRARDVVASPAFNRSPPPPARVGVVFGSSAKPPPSLVTSQAREPRLAAKTRVSEARRTPVGMGGGGGRTRASRSRSPARARDASSPEDSPYSRFMRLEPESVLSPNDEGFERTAREVTEAALREAKSAERKLRAFRESRRNRRETAGSSPGELPKRSFGGADARAPSRAGAGPSRRANSAPVVRMTKKATAIAAKNAPPDRARLGDGGDVLRIKDVEENDARSRRLGVRPGRAAAAFAFDADRARETLEASSRSRERAAEARASLRDSSLGRRPRREDFDDFEDAWEDAGRV